MNGQMWKDVCRRMCTLISEMWITEEVSQCTRDQTDIHHPSIRFCSRIKSCKTLKFCIPLYEPRKRWQIEGRGREGGDNIIGYKGEKKVRDDKQKWKTDKEKLVLIGKNSRSKLFKIMCKHQSQKMKYYRSSVGLKVVFVIAAVVNAGVIVVVTAVVSVVDP